MYKISDYTIYPGPRYITEGLYSGEDFRKTHLSNLVKDVIQKKIKLVIDLDGTNGYSTGFLEEAFGGLIREDNIRAYPLLKSIDFKSEEEPYLVDEILSYILNAQLKARLQEL